MLNFRPYHSWYCISPLPFHLIRINFRLQMPKEKYIKLEMGRKTDVVDLMIYRFSVNLEFAEITQRCISNYHNFSLEYRSEKKRILQFCSNNNLVIYLQKIQVDLMLQGKIFVFHEFGLQRQTYLDVSEYLPPNI